MTAFAGRHSFDYIVVGAGSAGCVLANRLTEDEDVTVLLLEAGGSDNELFIRMPAGVQRVHRDPRLNWNYQTDPEPQMAGRSLNVPRGKVLGGSSSINAMVYMRGHPMDYDRWASEFDLPTWDYAHCLPYFRKSERSERGESEYRGGSGPLGVSRSSYKSVLFDAFLEAGTQAGVGRSEDLNGYQPEGLALYDSTKWDGKRCSAAVAYLHPARHRRNLSLVTRALVHRVNIERGRAKGVTFSHGDTLHTAWAAREVLLCGGAINSPQLLMLSGIGPADALRAAGIDVLHDLPGVGRNLQEHVDITLKWDCTKPVTIAHLANPAVQLAAGARWLLTGGGPAASNIFEAGGLVRSNASVAYPNIQYHFIPAAYDMEGDKIVLRQGFQIQINQARQQSRGELRLRSNDPRDPMHIRFDMLSTEHDRREVVEAFALTRHIVAQPAFEAYRGKESGPGAACRTDAEILEYARRTAGTEYHPSCTCRMGHDEMAVVNSKLQVHGIEGLRVVDASVMPNILSANLNAPTMMIAEKTADVIRARKALPAHRPKFHFEEATIS
jgi:choline dehydrogenase